MKRTLHLIVILVVLSACQTVNTVNIETETSESSELALWYDHPAQDWMQEALPIGNGFLGAMFFGGIAEERIQFNEESLWAGGPGEWEDYNGGNRPGAHKYLPEVRRLLKTGQYEEAHALANKELTGIIKENKGFNQWLGFGAYQSFGDLFIRPKSIGEITEYSRRLDLGKAIGEVNYKSGDILHKRTYFASYPKRVLVFHFENDAKGGIEYEIELTSLHLDKSIQLVDNELVMRGNLENNGMAFESRILIDAGGGQLSLKDGIIQISATNEVTLHLTASTDYLNEYPTYKGRDFEKLNSKTIGNIRGHEYRQLLEDHIADYQSLFQRVSLELGKSEGVNLPTDERLQAYQNGGSDPDLEALYFQYGRYLLISSSRPGSMPANLQGKWNHINDPPWASDYHANINIQMIYWPAEVTNLSEVHEPLIEYIDRLRVPGRQTAKDFFDARGWVVNTMNNSFGFTAPGWDFPWGFFPAGAAWYGQHVWQHYDFNRNEDYLRNKAYPILKETAHFWLDYLTENEEGHLVSSPSYSPEHGGISTGAYMDIEIVSNLFNNTIKALEVLKIDHTFKQELTTALEKLLPLKIGRWGQLQEWKEDLDDPQNKHRHLSHLFALFPGYQISLIETPELAEAAKTSLIARGNEGTGWSIAWKVNFWARLQDAQNAYSTLRRALKLTQDKSYNMMDGGGVYPNLFSTHPPFQLDGNMGITAGIAEMLLQSHAGVIDLLPALPEEWNEGSVKGLRARGGVEIDIHWSNGILKEVVIKPEIAGSYKLKYKKTETILKTSSPGMELKWNGK